jgi:hypothetical protein
MNLEEKRARNLRANKEFYLRNREEINRKKREAYAAAHRRDILRTDEYLDEQSLRWLESRDLR